MMQLEKPTLEELLALMPEYPNHTTTKELTLKLGGETTNGPIGFRVRRRMLEAIRQNLVSERKTGRRSLWYKGPKVPTLKAPQETPQMQRAFDDPQYEDVLKHVPFFPQRATTKDIVQIFGGDSTVSPLSNRIRRRLLQGVTQKQIFTTVELGQSHWWRRGEPVFIKKVDDLGAEIAYRDPPPEKREEKLAVPKVESQQLSGTVDKLVTRLAVAKDSTRIQEDMLAVLLSHTRRQTVSDNELVAWAKLILNSAEVQFTDVQLQYLLKLVRSLRWPS